MGRKAAMTVNRPPDEVRQLWSSSGHRPQYIDDTEAAVSFRPAPGDRGTEIHVDIDKSAPGGKLGEAVQKLTGKEPLAKIKDGLRQFKQLVETGEVPRSEGTPEGESLERKLKPRPAQPLSESEREKVGV